MNSFVVVADCTGRNANVFYEIGVAHTLGKPVILLTQSEEDVPTDVIYIRYIKYESTIRGLAKFEKNLRRTLEETVEQIWPMTRAAREPRRAQRRPNSRR